MFRLFSFFLFTSIAFATPDAQELVLSAEARGVLAHHCTKCHGQQKQKGELRLDTKELAFKGGENGVVLVPGNPAESELLKRITLPKGHEDLMPPKDNALEPQEIETLRKWIAAGTPWPDGETAGLVFQRAAIAPRKPEFPAGTEEFVNPIDKFVAGYFRKKAYAWPQPVDDRTFLRRASLDSIGLMPAWDDLNTFKGDRAAVVDSFLARKADYATHWMSFWNDALRNDYSGTGYIDGGRQQISNWLYASLHDDKPYDQMVRELIVPNAESEGFIRGIKWRGNVSAGQRVELQAAQNLTQVFLGLNLKCASCHDSFINDYKLTDAHALAAVFADAPLDVYRCDKATGEKTAAGFLWPELGLIDAAKPRGERQQQLAALMVKRENGRLARTLVNRLWAVCFGRGMVEPVDVMDNLPWNQDLLDWLAWDFAENGFSIRHTLKLILTSRAYQIPAVAVNDADSLPKSSFVFNGPVVRRLSAEQFADAVGHVAAPLYFKRDFTPLKDNTGLAKGASWIWHAEPGISGIQFPEGKRYFRQTVVLPGNLDVRLARVVGSADNTFTFYIDGVEALSSINWEVAESSDVTEQIEEKKSLTLAVMADNVAPGAAGLRLALAIWFKGQKAPMIVETSPGWRSSAEGSAGWEKPGFDDSAWPSAQVLGPEGLPWIGMRNYLLNEEAGIVRASMVSNDAFQNILGRPIRDQVNMSRATQATLLQALTFANGRAFTNALDRAGRKWTDRFPDPGQRLEAIYHAALLRAPREDEREFASAAPADLLWSIVLLPEFQLIY
ncbi:MAG: beta-hexosaminidase [Chthoniobacteraceae bacterium]|nr:beta-hexosaminidase [Chthoniobacteraceae bacterium]